MAILTQAAVISYALSCGHVTPAQAQIMASFALHESGFRTDAINVNKNGSHDWGLYQFNDKTLEAVGLTRQSALDPCFASHAAGQFIQMLSRYNTGSPDRGVDNGYIKAGLESLHRVQGSEVRSPSLFTVPALTLEDQRLTPATQNQVFSTR